MKRWKRLGGLFFIFVLISVMTVPVFAAGGARLDKKSAAMYVGQSITLKVKGTKKKVQWSTTDKKVAAVHPATGKVTAKKAGRATIKAKVGGKILSCKLTVKKECLDKTSLTLSDGGTAVLRLNGGRITSVKSSKPSVAAIAKNGKIKAKKAGSTLLTIKSSTKRSYKCRLKVIQTKLSNTDPVVAKGDYTDISISRAVLKSVKSGDTKIAQVAMVNGKIRITGVKKGTAKIAATDRYNKTYTCKVKVEEPSIRQGEELVLKVRESSQLTLDGNSQKAVWSSLDPDIASVDETGNVTGHINGTTIISAKIGHISIECRVIVEKATYTVSFNSVDGSEVPAQTVTEDECAEEPEDPTKETYLFDGWYTDAEYTQAYDFTEPVRSDVTLYAKWIPAAFTVTFDSNGGSEVAAQGVNNGSAAIRPQDPTKEGYIFEGWYTDSGCTSAYDFETILTADITLYAQWTPLEVSIQFDPMAYEAQEIGRTVKGKVTCNGPDGTISNVSYTLKGENSEKTEQIVLGSMDDFEKDVLLENGSNIFMVTVETIDGTQKSESLEMVYDSGQVYDVKDPTVIRRGLKEAVETPAPETPETSGTPSENTYSVQSETAVNEEIGDVQPEGTVNEELGEETQPVELAEDATSGDIYQVTNLFNLYFRPEISFASREDFVQNDLHGEVAGYLSALDMMQVKFTGGTLPSLNGYSGTTDVYAISGEELEEYAQALEAQYSDLLDGVELELMYDDPGEAMLSAARLETNDGWGGNTANRWWHERVSAGEAWQYSQYDGLDFLTDITLGIVDAGFDKGHEDLRRIAVLSREDSAHDHGTHVAGIMAATANNGRGIAGIMYNNVSLRVYDAQKSNSNTMSDSQIMQGLAETVEAGAKVVNFSLGMSSSVSGTALNERIIKNEGEQASRAMGKLLGRGYDFIVVQAAGNGNDQGLGIDYRNNGMFCSVDAGNCYSSSKVTKDQIMDRILIASCVDDTDTLTQFSNGGNGSQLVAAPGNNIYSTVCNGYRNMSGTSMAAPIVSGVCGLAWSVDPALDGAEVVNIIKNNTSGYARTNSGSHTTGGMSIVTAFGTAGAAYDRRTDYYGYARDARTGDGIDAKIELSKADGTLIGWDITSSEAEDGKFVFPKKLPAGSYRLEISAEGYSSLSTSIYISESREETKNIGTFSLTEVLASDTYQIKLHWGETPRDLDSHLRATLENGDDYHVFYSSKDPYPYYANLDVDDTTSWGPETVTITDFRKLRNIKYAIHDYTNRNESSSKELSASGAYVEVIRGRADGTNEYRRFDVPRNIGGTEWDVFALDARGDIIPINTMTYCSSPGSVLGSGEQASSAEEDGQAVDYEKPYEKDE